MKKTPISEINANKMKMKKPPKGRKKIEIKKIEQVNNRQVTFSKRRSGLFKKASELCILTGAQIAVLVTSPGGRLFEFGHPTADVIIDRYLNNNDNNNNSNASTSPPPAVELFNRGYMEAEKELEAEKRQGEVIDQESYKEGGGVLWYEEDVGELGMEAEELEQYLSALVELKRKVSLRADELAMINKAPKFMGPNISDDVTGYANMMIPTGTVSGYANMMIPTGTVAGYANMMIPTGTVAGYAKNNVVAADTMMIPTGTVAGYANMMIPTGTVAGYAKNNVVAADTMMIPTGNAMPPVGLDLDFDWIGFDNHNNDREWMI